MVGYAIYLKKKKKNEGEWIQKLLKREFFGYCFDHQDQRRNEVNLFCIHCHRSLCQHCVSSSSHCHHKLIQIRRYVYHDVILMEDMQKLIDCSKVQTYKLNGSKVVFLNPRPNLKPCISSNGAPCCKVCDRSLQDQNQFCSIACKVSDASDKSNDPKNRFHSKYFPLPISEFSEITLDENQNNKSEEEKYLMSKSGLLKPNKQLHKRKGIPHRAPFC